MSDTLIPSAFLFRLAIPCHYYAGGWTARGVDLDERHVITSFHAELNGGPRFAEFRMGWNPKGLYFHLRTTQKKQSPWCRETRADESDGLSVWVDTRNTQNIHRAGRFCHRFVFLPQGAGRLMNEPTAMLMPVARAREEPRPVAPSTLKAISEKRLDGYILQAFVPAAAITGFDPVEHPRIGFYFAVMDRELGWQTFSLGPEFPFTADPSLWGTMELTPA